MNTALTITTDSRSTFAEAGPIPPAHVDALIALAARAPSVHNTQPWRFDYRSDGTLELHVDAGRALSIADPDARELVISCGAALLNLRLALRRIGRVPVVMTTPDVDDPWLLASIRARVGPGPAYDETPLIDAISRRHTHRGGFDTQTVSDEERQLIGDAAAAEGATLHFIEPGQLAGGLVSLARFADDALRADPEARAEMAEWTPAPGSTRPDGVPTTAYVRPGHTSEPTAGLPPRDFAMGREWGRPVEPSTRASALAVLVTDGDTTADWLRAGQALERALLTATTEWVFARFATQPLEVAHTRAAIRSLLGSVGDDGFPQMVLELGHASSLMLTPRRSVDDVLHRH